MSWYQHANWACDNKHQTGSWRRLGIWSYPKPHTLESRLIVPLHSCACAAWPRVQSGCHCAVGHCVIIGVTSHSASVKTSSPGSAASCLWGVALIPAAPVLLQHQPFTLSLHPATLQHPTAVANVGFGSWQSTTNMVKRKVYAKIEGEKGLCASVNTSD